MQNDLKTIKKVYGEKMAHFCRKFFPTLLEKEGLLYNLLSSRFAPNKFLYDDLIEQNKEYDFKNYIYSLFDVEKQEILVNKTPKDLLSEAGYNLYECNSEDDIQSYKKYYEPWEELCTFRDDRLEKCYVFFAVKKNVDEIKRENYKNPSRQDEYGTSVISIQFSKGDVNTLSIKNRYNHSVNNPDATYSNNLDNIIVGLTAAFEEYYGLHINSSNNRFELYGYVKANDGKYYKYNYEIDNIYYCPNNIIIDNFKVNSDYTDGSRYIVLDYFILDLKEKSLWQYDDGIKDSFDKSININKNTIIKLNNGNRLITINGNIKIEIDKYNRIIGYENEEIDQINNNFLYENIYLKYIKLKRVRTIGKNFLLKNKYLEDINIENVETINNSFLTNNYVLNNLNVQKLKVIGNNFFTHCPIEELELSSLEVVGDDFMTWSKLEKLKTPKLKIIKDNYLRCNDNLIKLALPSAISVGDGCLYFNKNIIIIEAPLLESVGSDFLSNAKYLKYVNMPSLEKANRYFLNDMQNPEYYNVPNLSEHKNFNEYTKILKRNL